MHSSPQSADDLALRLGDALLRSGASSASVTSSLLSIYRACRIPDVSVAVTMGQITISHPGQDGGPPHTRVHETTTGSLDIHLRSWTNRILEDVAMRRLGPEQALETLDDIEAQRTRASHWPAALGFGGISVGFSLLLGGSAPTTTAAGALALIVYTVFSALERIRAPGIFSLGAGGLMAVAGATAMSTIMDELQTAELIVATLAAWLAGIAAYGAVQDVITGWYLSATGRLLDVIIRTAGLVAGIALGIHLLEPLLGHDPGYLEALQSDTSQWLRSIAGAVLVSSGFALSTGGSGRILAALGAFGGLVQTVVLVLETAGVSSYAAILIDAVMVGALCVILTRILGLSSNATMTVVLLPLFPGMYIYQGLLGTIFSVEGSDAALLQGAITAFCLSTGGMLGQYVASEALWAARARQFARTHPGRTFRKEMPMEENSRDIMVPTFSEPFTS